MVRWVVALYLMVVTALGPWACCCSATRLTANLLGATPTPAPTTEPRCPNCCTHSATDARAATEEENHAPPVRHDCPCRRTLLLEALALPTPAEDGLANPWRQAAEADLSFALFLSTTPSGLGVPAPVGPLRSPLSLSCADRLDLLRQLRC